MSVAVISLHRNNAGRLPRYFAQVAALRQALSEHNFRVIAVHGDSTDNSRNVLIQQARKTNIDLDLVTFNHGKPEHGSTELPERLTALSGVLNAGLDSVLPTDHIVVYVESDLLWSPGALVPLISSLIQHGPRPYGVLAPLIMAGELFYDIWGFRDLKGNRFTNLLPYHPNLNGTRMELSSVGSCFVVHGDVARKCRVRDNNALVGWCSEVRAHGYRIAVDPSLVVRHPA